MSSMSCQDNSEVMANDIVQSVIYEMFTWFVILYMIHKGNYNHVKIAKYQKIVLKNVWSSNSHLHANHQ